MTSRRDNRATGRRLASLLIGGSVAVFFLAAVGVPYFNYVPTIALLMLFGLSLLMLYANREAD